MVVGELRNETRPRLILEVKGEHIERDKDIREQTRGDESSCGNRAGHSPGLRVTIHIEPEPPERHDQQPIEWEWHPVVAGKPEYDPYGLLPESHRIFIESTKDDYRWEADIKARRSDSEGLVCFGVRDFCPTLGRWLDHDQAGYVEGAILYPMPQDNMAAPPPTAASPAGSTRTCPTPT